MMRFTGSNNDQVPKPFGFRGPDLFSRAAAQSMQFHSQNLQQSMEHGHDQQVVTPSPRHG